LPPAMPGTASSPGGGRTLRTRCRRRPPGAELVAGRVALATGGRPGEGTASAWRWRSPPAPTPTRFASRSGRRSLRCRGRRRVRGADPDALQPKVAEQSLERELEPVVGVPLGVRPHLRLRVGARAKDQQHVGVIRRVGHGSGPRGRGRPIRGWRHQFRRRRPDPEVATADEEGGRPLVSRRGAEQLPRVAPAGPE
jgi:hypothetical protein